jgi:two-component system, chemotaxis family, CheB/CheR fusion protein
MGVVPHAAPSDNFLIAALGASAGGLEAFEKFFKHMAPDADIGFVIVQHLAPDHASALADLLGRHTQMAVAEVRDNTKVVPNCVYIIPPNATLTIKDCTLRVAAPVEPRGQRTPIDSLFSSLAADRGENAVCIMLSGTGTDGTLGLRAIKEHGGMAMAQTVESAKYDAILRSAIATGLVDHVLPVEEMPAKLLDYAAHLNSVKGNGKSNSIREQISAHLGKIHGLVRRRAGHDFSQYKGNTFIRRLERRMKALQIETVEQYVQLLEREPEEANQLFKDLLIGVTHFFPDFEAFETLGRQVIPKLFDGKDAGGQVRVGVVGCASGEEAYSIAILLCEHASMLDDPPKLQIFATDIDERGLEMARKGRYPDSITEHVSAERLKRFFTKQDNAYQVKRELRELCIFSNHSFIKDPPFSRLDLISCRNVMIYLGLDLQQKIVPLFHYALRPGGYLFLGPSENASSHQELFRAIDKKYRIFQRKESLLRAAVKFPLADISRPKPTGEKTLEGQERNLPKQLERVILKRRGPACVIVKENGDAVYFSGRVSRYLEQPTGTPEANVVNMAREDIRIPLRTSLHRAVSAHERAVQNQVSVQINGEVSRVDITVEPLTEFQDANLYMIVFEEGTPNSNPQPGESPAFFTRSEEIIRHLESELRSAREHAQAAFEELETSNEELQSANEEYQSTNEELETSKEELQSFNEELETVNSELNRKVTELDAANSDLQNLLNGTQIATIFLDTELHIRNFTPAAGSMFRLITGDVGRPITDLAAQFTDVDLMQDTRDVLATLSARERQVAGTGGRHYHQRILPYRTVHNVIAGVVLTFVDVTALKQAEQLATEAQDYAMSIVDTVREPLVVLDVNLRVKSASKAFFDKFAVSAEETLSKSLYDLGDRQWDIPDLRKLLTEVLPESKKIEDYEVEHEFPTLGRRTMLLNSRRVEQRDGKEPLLLLAIEDVTERKRAEETLRTHAEELSRLARGMVGRELRMIEMKKEVNELRHRLGEEVRYPLEFEQDGKESPDSLPPRNQP